MMHRVQKDLFAVVVYGTWYRYGTQGPGTGTGTTRDRVPVPVLVHLGTVQRHREGPDANRATHRERGPGPSNTTHRHQPPHRPERRPGHTRVVGPGTKRSGPRTRPIRNNPPGARQAAGRAQATRTSTPRRPDRANSAKKTGAHTASATSAPTKHPSLLLPHRRGQKGGH